MHMISDELLIDQIYEAAIVPSLWTSVLDQIALRIRATGAAVFLLSEGNEIKSIWSDSLHDLVTGWIEGGWQAKTQRAPRMMALNHAGFVTDRDIYRPGEMEKDEAFSKYLHPAGFGYGAGTGVLIPTGETAVYSIERRFETGPITREDCERLDFLRPHLARAAVLCCRAGLEQARKAAQLLEAIGLAGAVIRPNGALLASNSLFEQLVPAVMQDRRDRLRMVNVDADQLFGEALNRLKQRDAYDGVFSIPTPANENALPLIVHLLPIRGQAQDFFTDGSIVVLVTPIDRAKVPTAAVLQGLFDLSPAEAKVAHGIGSARSIDALANSLNVSRETVRTQLKAVLAKTGVRRQTELINLLAGKEFPALQIGLDQDS
jgi:DNA-binding CsgD family transcriptional regulator